MTVSRSGRLRAVLLYLGAVAVLGALLAPAVATVGLALVRHWPTLPYPATTPFRRYYMRALQLVALAGLWPLVRALGIRSWTDVGLRARPRAVRQLLVGLALGISAVMLARGAGLAGGPPALGLLGSWSFARRATTGAIVALLEELFFRGLLLGGLLPEIGAAAAILGTSLLFGAVHFMQASDVVSMAAVHWWSGLSELAHAFTAFHQAAATAPAVVNLTLAGIILGWAYWKTRSLALPIGIHAGWIFATSGQARLPWPAVPALVGLFIAVVWVTRTEGSGRVGEWARGDARGGGRSPARGAPPLRDHPTQGRGEAVRE